MGPNEQGGAGTDDAAAVLEPQVVTVDMPAATVGTPYEAMLPPFDLAGGTAGMEVSVERGLPPGLTAEATEGGRARISGIPREAGIYHFKVLAAVPGGRSAWHVVDITILAADKLTTTWAAPGSEQQTAEPASAASAIDRETEQLALAVQAAAPDSVAAPVVTTAGPGELQAPSQTAETALPTPSDEVGAVATAEVPTLGVQTSASGLPIIPAGDQGYAAAVEPQVATGNPTILEPKASSDDDGSGLIASGGSAPSPPHIGQAQDPQPAPKPDAIVAAIPQPQNLPPTLRDPLDGRLEAAQGQPLDIRLGAFDDEEGTAGLRLDVQGVLPNGVGLHLAQGGVAQISGTPTEAGEFDLRIAAIDPQGQVSRPVAVTLAVTLAVAPPAAGRSVRDYILAYDGGDCFLSRPVELGPKLARIEVFAPESRLQPVLDFDAAFRRDMGFEANIGMRPISEKQCTLIHALDQVAPQALDNSLVIALDQDEIASGGTLSGTISGADAARLYLLDHAGEVTDLSGFVKPGSGQAGFAFPISAVGPADPDRRRAP